MPRLKIVHVLLALLLLAACQNTAAPSSPAEPAKAQASPPTDPADVPRITAGELKALLDAGEKVVIADSRRLASYETTRIAGAISMPVSEVRDRAGELPADAKIVFYCT